MVFPKHKSYVNNDGYKQIYKPKSSEARESGFAQGYAPEHRVKASKMLKRPLTSDEIVHHKDGNKLNNRKNNLQVMTRNEHYRIHKK